MTECVSLSLSLPVSLFVYPSLCLRNSLVSDQLKREVAEVQTVLDELKATNANSEEVMAGIRDTWLEHLKAVVSKLNIRFQE